MLFFIKLILFIIILHNIIINLLSENGIRFMNLFELLEYNIKLYLISSIGFFYYKKIPIKILTSISHDPICIKMHRNLHNKYGKIVMSYIITSAKQYYILDPYLSKKILEDSPFLFNAGKIKTNFFKKFMPKNLGILKCDLNNKCPWGKARLYNENVLGTTKRNDFFNCIPKIINNYTNNPLLEINDFINVSYLCVSELIFGNSNNYLILKRFILKNKENFLKTNFYKDYIENLNYSYNNSPNCSLLYYANKFKYDDIDSINDQIPHWFMPFVLIIAFMVPSLLCVILNYNTIFTRLNNEIKKENFDINSKKTLLHYCVIEHIRLFNTVNINIQRSVKNNIRYNGIDFKKGDQIFILFSSILRNKQEFYKPDEFIPDRWENKNIKDQDIVFGIGPQQCPSKNITPLIYKSLIFNLLTKHTYVSSMPLLKTKNLYYIDPYQIKFSIL